MKSLMLVCVVCLLVVGPAMGGVVSGTFTSLNDQDTYIDLTAEGLVDWVDWGPEVNEKAGGTAINSALTLIGDGAIKAANDSRIRTSWTDGDPTAAGTDVRSFSYTGTVAGNGLSFTVTATEATQTLKVYVAGWNGEGILDATLSGGGTYGETFSARQDSNHQYGVFEIDFAGAGEILTISYTMGENGGGTAWDNIGLQSATLVPEPATMLLLGLGGLVLRRRK